MSVFNPSSTIQSDAITGTPTAQLCTNGAAHVTAIPLAGSRAQSVASMGISANVNAQVSPQAGLTVLGLAGRSTSGNVVGAIVKGATAAGGALVIPFRIPSGTLDLVTFYRVQP
jgi:hypothetical protein